MRKLEILLGIVAVVTLVLILVASGGKPSRNAPAWLTSRFIAHRGMWTEGPEAPENSLGAFERAAAAGYAVELDVQLTADGAVVVMHDENLEAMTGVDATVHEMTLLQLSKLRLGGGSEPIPTLEEALVTIGTAVPVLVEIKNAGRVGPLEDEVAKELQAYKGDVAVMSFNPYSLARMAEVAPEIPRGQLSGAFEGEDLPWYQKFLLRNLLMNWTSKPDFIAYDLRHLPSWVTGAQQLRGKPLVGWTAETRDERAAAEKFCDNVICNPGALPEQ